MKKNYLRFGVCLILMFLGWGMKVYAQPVQQWLTVVNSVSTTNDLFNGGGVSKFPVDINNAGDKIAVVNNNGVQPMTTSLNTLNGSVIFSNTHLVTANIRDLDFDGSDNLFTISHSTSDGYFRKFDPTGGLVFSNTINNSDEDNLLSIRINSSNGCNVYSRQRIASSLYNSHITMSYNSVGALQWSSLINDLDWWYGYDGRMTMDNNGNTIFTGKIQTTQSSPNAYNVIIRKVNSSGAQQWQTTYDFNSLMDHIIGRSLKVDNNGDVYLIIANSSNWTNKTIRLIKLNGTNGSIIYQQQIGTTDGNSELVVNSNGNIIIGGVDNVVRCFNPATGAQIWSLPFTNFQSLSNDANGNIYVTTSTGVSVINSSGTILHNIAVSLSGYSVTHLYTLSNNSSEIYVVGYRTLGSVNKVFVAKYANCSALPPVNAGTDIAVCPGTSITLNGSGANTYSWSNGASNGVAFTPLNTSTYTVTGTNTATGCTTTDQVVVTVNSSPVANAGADQSLCEGQTVTLQASGNAQYSWDNNVSNGFAFAPVATATYTLTATDLSSGCSSSDQVVITVNSLPTVNAGIDQTVCVGTSAALNASGATTYSWDNSVSNGVSFTPASTATYSVSGTDANGCVNSDVVTVTVNDLPIVSAGADQSICKGAAVTLSGTGASTYSWDNNIVDGVAFNPNATSSYAVSGTDANGCVNTDEVLVTVNEASASTLTESALDSYTLNGQTYTQSGTYTQVIPNAAGCDSTITLNLTLSFTGLDELSHSIRVYPNPASEELTIESSSALKGEFILFDAAGRNVLEGGLTGTMTRITLDGIASGFYSIQLNNESLPLTIIKQ